MSITENTLSVKAAINTVENKVKYMLSGGKRLTPDMLLGDPGITKTASIRHMVKANNWGMLTRNIGMMLVEEFGGIPQFVEHEREGINGTELHTRWSIPEALCQLRALAKQHQAVIFLLDDFHLARPELQAIGFELFNDHTMKGHALPENVHIVMAGNKSMKAGAKSMLSAVVNRVAVWNVELNPSEWLDAMADKLHPLISSFFMNKASQAYLQGTESNAGPWASARSWTNLSNHMEMNDAFNLQLTNVEKLALYSSYVGAEGASQFSQYVEIYSKMDIQPFFDHHEVVLPAPGLPSYAYASAITMEVYHRVMSNQFDEGIKQGSYMKFLQTLEAEMPELFVCSLYMLRSLCKGKLNDFTSTGAINTQFISENMHYFLQLK